VAVKRITVRVPPKLHKRVAQAARLRQVSLNQFVAEALEASTRRQASAGGSRRTVSRFEAKAQRHGSPPDLGVTTRQAGGLTWGPHVGSALTAPSARGSVDSSS
jgi:hypothetical protein